MEVTNLEKNNNLKICTFPNSFSKEAELSQLVEKEKKRSNSTTHLFSAAQHNVCKTPGLEHCNGGVCLSGCFLDLRPLK